MSLRPEISGFSLARLRALAGSRDAALLANLESRLAEGFESDDPDDERRIRRILEQAVMKGIPFPLLRTEEENHIHAVQLLATEGQEHLPTGSNVWKMEIFEELLEGVEGRLLPETVRLLRFFVDGRPLLGRKIVTSWNYYAYLQSQEVQALHASLAEFLKDSSDPTGEGFLEEFQTWLEAIREEGRDLWFIAE